MKYEKCLCSTDSASLRGSEWRAHYYSCITLLCCCCVSAGERGTPDCISQSALGVRFVRANIRLSAWASLTFSSSVFSKCFHMFLVTVAPDGRIHSDSRWLAWFFWIALPSIAPVSSDMILSCRQTLDTVARCLKINLLTNVQNRTKTFSAAHLSAFTPKTAA